MLDGVVVDVADGHDVFEVRVPADREVHGSVGLGVGAMVERCLQGADGSVHEPLGTRVAEDADPAELMVWRGRVPALRVAAKRREASSGSREKPRTRTMRFRTSR